MAQFIGIITKHASLVRQGLRMKLIQLNLVAILALVVRTTFSAQSEASTTVDMFIGQVQPILDEHCVICHMTGAENGGLALESGRSQAGLVGAPSSESKLLRVRPGEPAASYLLLN